MYLQIVQTKPVWLFSFLYNEKIKATLRLKLNYGYEYADHCFLLPFTPILVAFIRSQMHKGPLTSANSVQVFNIQYFKWKYEPVLGDIEY